MRINEKDLPPALVEYIKHPDPIAGEDIVIEDGAGSTIGVIIQPNAYAFFLKKIEEEEDGRDRALGEACDRRSKTLRELMDDSDDGE